jgi:glucose 1-dehydrogenase/3-oxoacyl-[acyl-carrier protein] reductase
MTDAAIDAFGTLDLLVNNAGVESIVPLLEMTEDEWERVTHTNLKGAFLCTQAAAKRMVASGRGGAIVNIGSVLSRVVLAGRTAYAPSKRAIAGLTANSAQELGVYGIRVNCIHPGFIDTDMTAWARNDPDALSQVLAKIAIERAGQPEDVAHAAVFLLSEDAAYITGTSIYVDGGFSL